MLPAPHDPSPAAVQYGQSKRVDLHDPVAVTVAPHCQNASGNTALRCTRARQRPLVALRWSYLEWPEGEWDTTGVLGAIAAWPCLWAGTGAC